MRMPSVELWSWAGPVVSPSWSNIAIKSVPSPRSVSRRMRLWRNLNTAAAYVQNELGVERFEVDMSELDIAADDRSRPDAAERQRQLRGAAEHDAWFRAQVQEALDGLKDGTNKLIGEEEWKASLAKKIAALEKRIAQGNG
jgi:hypothetical protein